VTVLAVAVSGRGVVDPSEPVIRADDDALLRGRGAFETLRVYGGRPFELDAHLERLTGSAQRIGLPSVDRGGLGRLVGLALAEAGAQEASLRMFWTPGPAGGQPTALVLVSDIPAWIDEVRARGTRVVTLLGIRAESPWLLPGTKSTSYAVNIAAEAEARRRDADDAVFVDGDGIVLEGPVTNVWWRCGDVLRTPALELGILAGVTRKVLLRLAPTLGYHVEEGVFDVASLREADEAFTSSSVREVMPVSTVDDHPLGRGPASGGLQAALRAAAVS
jgi:4-amino-4-deoxychorismate lyase